MGDRRDRQLGWIKREVYDLLNLVDIELDLQYLDEYDDELEAHKALLDTTRQTSNTLREIFNELHTPKGFDE